MRLITPIMEEESLLLVLKVIGIFKKWFFDVALLSKVTDNEFKKINLFDVSRFSVEKENFPSTIYNSSHPSPDKIQE